MTSRVRDQLRRPGSLLLSALAALTLSATAVAQPAVDGAAPHAGTTSPAAPAAPASGAPAAARIDYDTAHLERRLPATRASGPIVLDGLLDAGETPVPDGVVVNLWSADGSTLVATTTTTGGAYLFDELLAGGYVVEIPASQFAEGAALEGYRSSSPTGADDQLDGDDNGAPAGPTDPFMSGIRTGVIALGGPNAEPMGEVPTSTTVAADANAELTVDLGVFQPTFSLGNTIWHDLDDDGVVDAAEPMVPDGTTVRLYDEGNSLLATSTTTGGQYLFDGLIRGEYRVETDLPVGYRSSTPTDTTDTDNTDHGSAVGTAVTSGVVMLDEHTEPLGENPDNDPVTADGNENLTIDLGIVPLFTLGNQVWFDLDDSGVIEAGEPVVPDGVVVNLLSADGATVLDTTTTAGGLYLFTGPLAGDYVVELDASNFATGGLLEHWHSSTGIDSSDTDGTDHGAPDASGSIRSAVVTLGLLTEPTGEEPSNDTVTPDTNSNLTVDFGLSRLAVGNHIWLDSNDNGVFDTGEPGVGGVTVELWAADASGAVGGAPVATTTTDSGGFYLFDGLDRGTYVVRIPASEFAAGGLLEGYISTEGNGHDAPSADDGVDLDDNGIGDEANGWTQTLPFTIDYATAPTGETMLAGDTTQTDDGADLDADIDLTVDLGFVTRPPMSLGNQVWRDVNDNGLYDTDETPIDGVTVELYRDADGDGQPDSATAFEVTITADGGFYLFTDLTAGTYVVVIPASQFAPGGPLEHMVSSTGSHAADSDIDLDDSGIQASLHAQVVSSSVTLSYYDEPTGETAIDPSADTATDGNSNLTVDFGFYPLGSLGDLVWNDVDRDGIQDGGEPGVAGVRVELYDGTGVLVASTVTAADGSYLFGDLRPGDYSVTFVISTIPSGFQPSVADAGSDEAADSDGDVTTGHTATFHVVPGGHEPRVDFGVHLTVVDLTVRKALQGSLTAGKSSTWIITVSNNGPDTETGTITAIDDLPSLLSYTSAGGDGWICSASGQKVTCTTDADLAVGASLPPITVTALVSRAAVGTITNGATVRSGDDTNVTNNESLSTGPVAGGSLPGTGTDSVRIVWTALAVLALGALLVAGARRRRATTGGHR